MGYIKDRAQKVYGTEPITMDELAHCVITLINSYKKSTWRPGTKGTRIVIPKVVGFSWNLTFDEHVSNSHSAPEGCSTNWCATDDGPTNYPGLFGRVWIRFSKEDQLIGFGSDPFAITLTHTGTGGSGTYNGPWTTVYKEWWTRNCRADFKKRDPEPRCYSFDYKIFLSDWPNIEKLVLQKRDWCLLSGDDFKFSHEFLWEDPATKDEDKAYLKRCGLCV